MTDSWPQMSQGKPVPGTWRQPPRQPGFAAPATRPDDPSVLDASLLPAAPAPVASEPAEPPQHCLECGGEVEDGYCTQCGAKAPTEREHFEQSPAPWIGAVCDRGVKHPRNEDALATGYAPAGEDGVERAVMVVCDGVTTSTDSDVASLAAASAACDVLLEGRPDAFASAAGRAAALTSLFARAAAVANDAVTATTAEGEPSPAAATFVGALIAGDLVHVGNVGDSRAYWFPDGGEGRILTRDDSMAEESIASGVPRKDAEGAADAHTITRWLGIDAVDVVPHVASQRVTGAGWVLVCSDGLWNYASEPADLGRVLADAQRRATPLPAADVTTAADQDAAAPQPAAPQPAAPQPAGQPSAGQQAAPAADDVAPTADDSAPAPGEPVAPAPATDATAAPLDGDRGATAAAPAGDLPAPVAASDSTADPDTEAATARVVPAAAQPAEPAQQPSAPTPAQPVDIARRMVRWAIEQGGHDNISVCLARVGEQPQSDASADLAADQAGDEVEVQTRKIVPAGTADAAPLGASAGPAVATDAGPAEADDPTVITAPAASGLGRDDREPVDTTDPATVETGTDAQTAAAAVASGRPLEQPEVTSPRADDAASPRLNAPDAPTASGLQQAHEAAHGGQPTDPSTTTRGGATERRDASELEG